MRLLFYVLAWLNSLLLKIIDIHRLSAGFAEELKSIVALCLSLSYLKLLLGLGLLVLILTAEKMVIIGFLMKMRIHLPLQLSKDVVGLLYSVHLAAELTFILPLGFIFHNCL